MELKEELDTDSMKSSVNSNYNNQINSPTTLPTTINNALFSDNNNLLLPS